MIDISAFLPTIFLVLYCLLIAFSASEFYSMSEPGLFHLGRRKHKTRGIVLAAAATVSAIAFLFSFSLYI